MGASKPRVKTRRNRKNRPIRKGHIESSLAPSKLIYPLCIHDHPESIPIESMPGCSVLAQDGLLREAEEAQEDGIKILLLIGFMPACSRSVYAEGSWDREGLLPKSIGLLKDRWPELVVATDVALVTYSSEGLSGVPGPNGDIDQEKSLEVLCRQAVCHAEAGADIVAPSDRFDGSTGIVRDALDSRGFSDVLLLAYTAKYASALYGPLHSSMDSRPRRGDSFCSHLNPPNVREALREVTSDELEGADILLVKPAGPYLDIIRHIRDCSNLPVAAYQVSGEYAMIKAACAHGWLDEQSVVLETLAGIRRAGADMVVTYHAREAARWLVP